MNKIALLSRTMSTERNIHLYKKPKQTDKMCVIFLNKIKVKILHKQIISVSSQLQKCNLKL